MNKLQTLTAAISLLAVGCASAPPRQETVAAAKYAELTHLIALTREACPEHVQFPAESSPSIAERGKADIIICEGLKVSVDHEIRRVRAEPHQFFGLREPIARANAGESTTD